MTQGDGHDERHASGQAVQVAQSFVALADALAKQAPAWEPGTRAFEDVRQARLDVLGDLVADHLDTDAVLRLLSEGAPPGLPFVPPGAP